MNLLRPDDKNLGILTADPSVSQVRDASALPSTWHKYQPKHSCLFSFMWVCGAWLHCLVGRWTWRSCYSSPTRHNPLQPSSRASLCCPPCLVPAPPSDSPDKASIRPTVFLMHHPRRGHFWRRPHNQVPACHTQNSRPPSGDLCLPAILPCLPGKLIVLSSRMTVSRLCSLLSPLPLPAPCQGLLICLWENRSPQRRAPAPTPNPQPTCLCHWLPTHRPCSLWLLIPLQQLLLQLPRIQGAWTWLPVRLPVQCALATLLSDSSGKRPSTFVLQGHPSCSSFCLKQSSPALHVLICLGPMPSQGLPSTWSKILFPSLPITALLSAPLQLIILRIFCLDTSLYYYLFPHYPVTDEQPHLSH